MTVKIVITRRPPSMSPFRKPGSPRPRFLNFVGARSTNRVVPGRAAERAYEHSARSTGAQAGFRGKRLRSYAAFQRPSAITPASPRTR